MKRFFFGGVTPVLNKETTQRRSVVPLDPAPARVYLPLAAGPEGEVLPAVRPGNQVLVGQPVALGQGLTASIHASVSGRVATIQEHPHPLGGVCPTIVIENDAQNTPWPHRPAPLESEQITLDLLLGRVREAGIIGMGGGGFPTAEKLRLAAGQIDTLILNAAECEPYVTADYRLVVEAGEDILRGARTLARCLGARETVLVIQQDKLDAKAPPELPLGRGKDRVELLVLPAHYPLGAERPLIQAVTGREVPQDKTPIDLKCLVLNVATVLAIQESLSKGLALTHRIVTVAGGAVSRPRNLLVPLGSPLSALLEGVGGLKEQPRQILTGGPMMGRPLQDLSAPVTKTTNALVCLTQSEYDEYRRETGETVCIHCGNCVTVCPMHLSPVLIRRAVRRGVFHRLPALHPQDCIQCGSCAYVCPARIPLPELVRQSCVFAQEGERKQ